MACGIKQPKASQDRGSAPHRPWGAARRGQSSQLAPSLMTGAGLGSPRGRGGSPAGFLQAGAKEGLHMPPLLTSTPQGLSSPSVSCAAGRLQAAGCVPRLPFSRRRGRAAKCCACPRSGPAKKPVLGCGKTRSSPRLPGAAVRAGAAGDREESPRAGGACSWMRGKEVSSAVAGLFSRFLQGGRAGPRRGRVSDLSAQGGERQ